MVIPSITPLVTPSIMACDTQRQSRSHGEHAAQSTCHNTLASKQKMYSHAATSPSRTFCACSLVDLFPHSAPASPFPPEVKFNWSHNCKFPSRAPRVSQQFRSAAESTSANNFGNDVFTSRMPCILAAAKRCI